MRNIRNILLAIAGALLLTCCSDESDIIRSDVAAAESDSAVIEITLSPTMTAQLTTRADEPVTDTYGDITTDNESEKERGDYTFNEDVISFANLYFYKSETDNKIILQRTHITPATWNIKKANGESRTSATFQIRMSDEDLKALGLKDDKGDNVANGQCQVFVVTNCETYPTGTGNTPSKITVTNTDNTTTARDAVITDVTGAVIKTTDFGYTGKQDHLVMTGTGTVSQITDGTEGNGSTYKADDINLTHLAAKIMLSVDYTYHLNNKTTPASKDTWLPDLSDIKVRLVNGMNGIKLDGSSYTESDGYFSTIWHNIAWYDKLKEGSTTETERVDELSKMELPAAGANRIYYILPFYTYPTSWKKEDNTKDYEHMPVFIVTSKWYKDPGKDKDGKAKEPTEFATVNYQIVVDDTKIWDEKKSTTEPTGEQYGFISNHYYVFNMTLEYPDQVQK